MSKIHVVREGDHVPKIAGTSGFTDFTTVWDHPQNQELKAQRDPCVLNPGDHVFIPDARPFEVSLPTGRRHVVVIKRPKIRLRVVLKDVSDRPLAGACQLKVGNKTFDVILDGTGMLDHEIPLETERCTIVLPERELSVLVGHLTPVDEPSGQRARLNNLGYEVAPPDEKGEDDEDDEEDTGAATAADGAAIEDDDPQLRSAIEEFQCDQALKVTGVCDKATQAKLLEVHGA